MYYISKKKHVRQCLQGHLIILNRISIKLNLLEEFYSISVSQSLPSMPNLLSLTHVMVEKILFLDQIFEMEILMDLHNLRFSESEKRIFSNWPVYVCLCLSVISMAPKQIITATLFFVPCICMHLYHT